MCGDQVTIMKSSVFDGIPTNLRSEWVERIAFKKGVRIERIVSRGHCSPEGFWYDQAETEWVLLISGAARIVFEEDNTVVEMRAGDHIVIPPRARHRVDWTTPDEETIWLAVFY
jgi:cupin 2 domain-containing protein